MKAPSVDIKDYLVALEDSGLVFATNLFIGVLPEVASMVTCLFDTSGGGQDPNEIHNPAMQILTRGIAGGYEAAYAQIFAVVERLNDLTNVTVNSTRYIRIWKMNEIAHVGNDEKGRPIFTCTMVMKRT